MNRGRSLIDGWLGHLVNDGAVCSESSERSVVDYYADAVQRSNVVPVPIDDGAVPIMCYVTTRPIARGEELFGLYGHGKQMPPPPPSSCPAHAGLRTNSSVSSTHPLAHHLSVGF